MTDSIAIFILGFGLAWGLAIWLSVADRARRKAETRELKDRLRIEKAMVYMHELEDALAADERNAFRGQIAQQQLTLSAAQQLMYEVAQLDCECQPGWQVGDFACLTCRAAILSPKWIAEQSALLDAKAAPHNHGTRAGMKVQCEEDDCDA